MPYILIPDAPPIHTTPLPEVTIARSLVSVTLDTADEQRHHLTFRPYQAVRITTEDCFLVAPGSGLSKGGLFILDPSPWMEELRHNLARIDRYATFLDQAYHYVVPIGDDILEVVAWGLMWEGPSSQGNHPKTL